MSIFLIILALVAIFLSIFLYKIQRKSNYWANRGVACLKSNFIFGNYKDYIVLNKSIFEVANSIYDQFPREPYVGVYYGTEPTLIIRDPEYVKLILNKDFYYFNSRENGDYSDKEVLTQNIFFAQNDKWKVVRQNLTPFFSSARMKKMFYLIEECCDSFEKLIDHEAACKTTEVRSMMARYTMDCIGSCAFGINTKAMSLSETKNPFREIGHKIFESSNERGFKAVVRAIWPDIFYKLGFQLFPPEISDFFLKMLTTVFQQRQYKHSGRNDFIDLILGLKEKKYITGDSIFNLKGGTTKAVLEVNDGVMCAQCNGFFAAGFETSSTTSSFLLYQFAKNPETQQRALEEVDRYFEKHQILEYECIFEMPFLDACINETLRLYPVLGVLTRELVEDYTMPTGLPLTKGVRIHIPVYALHHDAKYFPDPEAFKPERFLDAQKEEIVPYTYMPFGEGPRMCIGRRFAKMQIIAGLLTLLKKYRVELAEDSPKEIKFEPRALTTQPTAGIKLKLIPRFP